MSKLLSPAGFRTTRRSSLFRYILVAGILLVVFYTINRRPSTPAPVPYTPKTQPPPPAAPAAPPPIAPQAEVPPKAPPAGRPPLYKPGQPAAPPPIAELPPKKGTGTSGHAKAGKGDSEKPKAAKPKSGTEAAADSTSHPIEKLMYNAQLDFNELLSKQSKTLKDAARAYRKRRGRHPPPGFDKWWDLAKESNALVIEDFFDQVYHDLEPFWGIDPAITRKEARSFEMKIHIRDHKCNTTSDWPWTLAWLDMFNSIVHLLPDMDVSLNAMDEPRLVAPWERVNGYMEAAAKTRGFPKAKEVQTTFQNLPPPHKGDENIELPDKDWEDTKPYWPVARRGCHPQSSARQTGLAHSFEDPPVIEYTHAKKHMLDGFVSNFTMSSDPCHQPDLQSLEGIFINPISTSATKTLFPMFGGSKLAVNNEILLPPPAYWKEDKKFFGKDEARAMDWDTKKNQVIWRGVATGGENTPDNWRGFQRHRFVSMNNGTKVGRVESGKPAENFALPSKEYNLPAQRDGKLGDWVGEWADAGFIDMMCQAIEGEGTCYYTDYYFKKVNSVDMDQQFQYKYLPDIDGNSYSGRYRGFLQSTSLPIKATLWREWHDSRLIAWKHFVPMDNRFGDFYGIMDYFLGYDGKNSHDKEAEMIAYDGKEWAERVLRKEDMQLYTLRLLLEYGRVTDNNREKMGWVDDILNDPLVEGYWKK